MTIIEARELAMQGKTVISPGGIEYTNVLFDSATVLTVEHVFGEWREKKEPRRFYRIERADGTLMDDCYNHKELVTTRDQRIVEFVEVVP
jgi:hypothetical protein